MEETLIRHDLFKVVVQYQLLESVHSGGSAVQRLVTDCSGRGGLIGQGLWDLEVVQRWGTDGPRVAEERLSIAINDAELGRVRLGCQKRE